ncbi:hypothetical protein N7533_013656 [Penicillium manginii]|uniref:uncharacterized protein n=1 Tax=Penicillium manginii TaxID=203109 RepID=UPI0025496C8E|nr:uncharacterized protein N7533_013656 [Penicillium manginii]KAJ5733209.1 hypothetical protein N7533_013656 [Penicillium manginii]
MAESKLRALGAGLKSKSAAVMLEMALPAFDKERSGEEMKREIYQHHIDLLAGSLYQRLHIPSTVHSNELHHEIYIETKRFLG